MDITHFHNLHAGEICLLVGNGANLTLTPPKWFGFPSFGMNTIHKYEGWKPTYYTAVDSRVTREFGSEIAEKYADIPKFVPSPNLDKWQGWNFYRFYFRPGPLWPNSQARLWPSSLLSNDGISYSNVMTVAMQLAYYMGFSTMLIIGMEHRPRRGQDHFWGCDHGMPADPPVHDWLEAYKILVSGMAEQGIRVVNISRETYVDDSIIPRDDWRKYVKEQFNVETTDIPTYY